MDNLESHHDSLIFLEFNLRRICGVAQLVVSILDISKLHRPKFAVSHTINIFVEIVSSRLTAEKEVLVHSIKLDINVSHMFWRKRLQNPSHTRRDK